MQLPPINGATGRRKPSRSTSPRPASRQGSQPASRSGSRPSSRSASPIYSYADVQRKNAIKAKFRELDANRDGTLSFDELVVLLQKGPSEMSRREAEALYEKMDKNHDGTVSFDEFVDYVFEEDVDRGSLQTEFQSAKKRNEQTIAQAQMSVTRERTEKTMAEESGRGRLGDLVGMFTFAWSGGNEMKELVTLNLEADGSFYSQEVTELDNTLTDTQEHRGIWEVSATSREVLLCEDGMSKPDRLLVEGSGLQSAKDTRQ